MSPPSFWFFLSLPALCAAAPSSAAKQAHDKGVEQLKAQRVDEAIASFKKAVAASSDYTDAHVALGNALLAKKLFAPAAASFEKAVALDPDRHVARYNLAYALRKSGAADKSAEAYRVYLQANPRDADAYYGLAEALKAAGDPAAAAEAYRGYARVEARPDREKWKARALEQADALAAAAPKAAPKAAAPKPAPTPHLSFSKMNKKTEPAPAVESTVTAKTSAGPPARTRPPSFELGLAALQRADFESALDELEKAHKQAFDDPLVLAALGSAHLGLADGVEAASAYRRALDAASSAQKPPIYFGLAESFRIEGRLDDAQKAYDRVLDNESASANLKKLARDRLDAIR